MFLDKVQIQTIETQLLKRGAPNYQEVLVELIDDVASDIEKNIARNNVLGFEAALKISLDRYSRPMLKQLGREKEAAIMRNYAKMEWKMIKTWFSWPKIAIICFLTLVFGWFLTRAMDFGKPVLIPVYFTLLFLPLIQVLLRGWKRWRFNRSLPRKVLSVKIGPLTSGLFSILPTMLYLPQIFSEEFLGLNLVSLAYYWYYQAFLLIIIWISVFAIAPILEEKGRAQAVALMAASSS